MLILECRLSKRLLDACRDGVLLIGATGQIEDLNSAAIAITGYSREELVGRSAWMLASDRHASTYYTAIKEVVADLGCWSGDIWLRDAHDAVRALHLTIVSQRDDLGGPAVGYGAILEDVPLLAAPPLAAAEYDELADLPNPARFKDRIEESLASVQLRGGRIALLKIAVDQIAEVRDSLGRAASQALLRQIAARLVDAIRSDDTLARDGAYDFVVLARGVASSIEAATLAERLIAAASAPCTIHGQEVTVAASVGIALYPGEASTVDGLLEQVGTAARYASRQGRSSFEFFSRDMSARARETLLLMSSLRHAIDHEEFEVHYQPQFTAGSRELVGMEALVRWRQPDNGLVSPTRFIPVAETSGLIVPLGEWVLREAVRQNRAWQDAGLAPVPVAVNVSPRQFRGGGIITSVHRALSDFGLAPEHLEIEVTESTLMDGGPRTIDTMQHLKAIGVRLSIDDFGTGYSSLAYLGRFPVDTLKVDQTFVSGVGVDLANNTICRAIIALAKSLGLTVIAEGVETDDQLAFVLGCGADMAQGYLLGRPVPATEMAAVLARSGATPTAVTPLA